MGENEFFLRFRPLISERQQLFEFFWVDHGAGGVNADERTKEQKRREVKGGKAFSANELVIWQLAEIAQESSTNAQTVARHGRLVAIPVASGVRP